MSDRSVQPHLLEQQIVDTADTTEPRLLTDSPGSVLPASQVWSIMERLDQATREDLLRMAKGTL